MAHDPPRSAHSIFAEAAKRPPAARGAFLAEACGADEALRRRIEMMLAARDAAAGFSPSLAHDAAAQVHADAITPPTAHGHPAGDNPHDDPHEERLEPDSSVDVFAGARRRRPPSAAPLASIVRDVPNGQIGPYRLLERLGAGGFGVVFLAEQDRPVRRLVAIKIIKLGMDTSQVIARFDAERQALAIMDHPNIAKVFDAGATETGRPYFVMELVKGVPITHHCDTHELDLGRRLDLFRKVCLAVQHAHQKGVIHRDIKPSNVLVTVVDGEPVPKIIDFGIAKATHARLTERTMVTEANQFIGTPEYMSPEQADTSGLDIDTRTDIYSLGVLLYELLTGTTPLEPLRLRQAGLTTLQRMICDEEAPRPSARVEALGPALDSVAHRRRIPAARLATALRGDLDWIALKAIEKDRNRRYDTAIAFAADITRHLTNRPVEASPPSTAYRLRKFVRRNRRGVIAGGVVAATVVLGVVGTGVGLVMALRQAHHSEKVNEYLVNLFTVSDPIRSPADDDAFRRQAAEAVALFDNDESHPILDSIDLAQATSLRAAGLFDEAGRLLETRLLPRIGGRSEADPLKESSVLLLLAMVRSDQGRTDDAVNLVDRAIDLLDPGRSHPETVPPVVYLRLADIERAAGKPARVFEALANAATASRHLFKDKERDARTVSALCQVAAAFATGGDAKHEIVVSAGGAEPFLRGVVQLANTSLPIGHAGRLQAQMALADYLTTTSMFTPQTDKAAAAQLDVVDVSRDCLGESSVSHLDNLARVARQLVVLRHGPAAKQIATDLRRLADDAGSDREFLLKQAMQIQWMVLDKIGAAKAGIHNVFDRMANVRSNRNIAEFNEAADCLVEGAELLETRPGADATAKVTAFLTAAAYRRETFADHSGAIELANRGLAIGEAQGVPATVLVDARREIVRNRRESMVVSGTQDEATALLRLMADTVGRSDPGYLAELVAHANWLDDIGRIADAKPELMTVAREVPIGTWTAPWLVRCIEMVLRIADSDPTIDLDTVCALSRRLVEARAALLNVSIAALVPNLLRDAVRLSGRGAYDEAAEIAGEALDRLDRLGAEARPQDRATALAIVGDAARIASDRRRSNELMRQSLEVLRACGAERSDAAARPLIGLALLHVDEGSFVQAQEELAEAEAILGSNLGEPIAGAASRGDLVRAMIELYSRWHDHAPADGHDRDAQRWRNIYWMEGG